MSYVAQQAYLPDLYAHGPSTARPGKVLVVELDDHRKPVAQQTPADV
jgi:D-glycerate 3-kinase